MHQRLLIIDDDQSIHRLLALHLADEPIDVFCASDGDEGLAKAAADKPDLILLDVDMPGMDGFEVCRRLKAEPGTQRIPVLFLTGSCAPQLAIRGLDMGAADFVNKPFHEAELKARVRAHLRTKQLLDLLEHKAHLDGLTGLWSRAYFDQRLSEETALRARRPAPLVCIFVDVDKFKSVNDRFGHPFGDRVLREIGQTFAAETRTEDCVCRYGGEEFVVLSPGIDLAQGVLLAERLRAHITSLEFLNEGQPVSVTASFGVADTCRTDSASLVARADAALYRAKHEGRNCVRAAEPDPLEPSVACDALAPESDLHHSISP